MLRPWSARRLAPALLVLGLTAGAQGGIPLHPADFVLAPATLSCDADSQQVRALLGAPEGVDLEPNPFDPGNVLRLWHYPQLEVTLAGGGVLGLTLLGPPWSTHRGARVGDTPETVRRLYGEPGFAEPESWEYQDPDQGDGLHVVRFDFRHGRVTRIFLGWVLD